MQDLFRLNKIYLIKRTKEWNAKSIENNELEFELTHLQQIKKESNLCV